MAYEYNGVEYPSVTTITGQLDKPALVSWSARCAVDYVRDNLDEIRTSDNVHRVDEILALAQSAHNAKKDEAATAGTKCHTAIERHIAGDHEAVALIIGSDELAKAGFLAFLRWEADNHVVWEQTECTVVSVLHGYMGRFDAIAVVNGVRTLIDFKTSSAVYDEMKWQLCAYRQAFNEMLDEGKEPIERLAILHLDKQTGEPTYKPVINDIERMTELFNTLTWAYYLTKNRRLKNNRFVEAAKNIGGI